MMRIHTFFCLTSSLFFLFHIHLHAQTPLNPAGIVQGETATYWVSVYPTNFPDNLIVWTATPSGLVSFPQGPTGRVVTVQGEFPGDVVLEPTITGFPQFTPALHARVITQSTVNVHAYIICSTNGHVSITSGNMQTMFSHANEIWRQVGVAFQIASTHFVTNDALLRLDKIHGEYPLVPILCAYGSHTNGINCYFVDWIKSANGLTYKTNVVIATNGTYLTLSHEFGHACGLKDIYIDHDEAPISVTENISSNTLAKEWGSATDTGYYADTLQSNIIQRLLMYGVGVNSKADISYGDIAGLWYTYITSNGTRVKIWNTNSLAPVGFFQHGNPHPVSQ